MIPNTNLAPDELSVNELQKAITPNNILSPTPLHTMVKETLCCLSIEITHIQSLTVTHSFYFHLLLLIKNIISLKVGCSIHENIKFIEDF